MWYALQIVVGGAVLWGLEVVLTHEGRQQEPGMAGASLLIAIFCAGIVTFAVSEIIKVIRRRPQIDFQARESAQSEQPPLATLD